MTNNDMMKEPDDRDEQAEPNPDKKQPLVPESDTDNPPPPPEGQEEEAT